MVNQFSWALPGLFLLIFSASTNPVIKKSALKRTVVSAKEAYEESDSWHINEEGNLVSKKDRKVKFGPNEYVDIDEVDRVRSLKAAAGTLGGRAKSVATRPLAAVPRRSSLRIPPKNSLAQFYTVSVVDSSGNLNVIGRHVGYRKDGIRIRGSILNRGVLILIIKDKEVFLNGNLVCDDIQEVNDKLPTYQKTRDGATFHTNLHLGEPITEAEIIAFENDWTQYLKARRREEEQKVKKLEQKQKKEEKKKKRDEEERNKKDEGQRPNSPRKKRLDYSPRKVLETARDRKETPKIGRTSLQVITTRGQTDTQPTTILIKSTKQE